MQINMVWDVRLLSNTTLLSTALHSWGGFGPHTSSLLQGLPGDCPLSTDKYHTPTKDSFSFWIHTSSRNVKWFNLNINLLANNTTTSVFALYFFFFLQKSTFIQTHSLATKKLRIQMGSHLLSLFINFFSQESCLTENVWHTYMWGRKCWANKWQ